MKSPRFLPLKVPEMIKGLSIVTALVLVCLPVAVAEEPGLMGHWSFDTCRGLCPARLEWTRQPRRNPRAEMGSQRRRLRASVRRRGRLCRLRQRRQPRHARPDDIGRLGSPLTASAREPGIVGKYFDSYALTLLSRRMLVVHLQRGQQCVGPVVEDRSLAPRRGDVRRRDAEALCQRTRGGQERSRRPPASIRERTS